MVAYRTIVPYENPVRATMINADAPITGGMTVPPVDAAASIPPATAGRYPVRIIMGIVIFPVIATLADAEPEMLAVIKLAPTAAFAPPPARVPRKDRHIFVKKSDAPDRIRNTPNTRNRNKFDART